MSGVSDVIKRAVPASIPLESYSSIVKDAEELVANVLQKDFNTQLNTFNQRLYTGYYGVSLTRDEISLIISYIRSFGMGIAPGKNARGLKLTNQSSFDIEYDLVNELHYVLLGSSSQSFTFKKTNGDKLRIAITMNLNALQFNQMGLLYEFIELALMFKSLKDVNQTKNDSTLTAFSSFRKSILNEYSLHLNSLFRDSDTIGFLKFKAYLSEWNTKLKFLFWLHQKSESVDIHEFLNVLLKYSQHGDESIKLIAQKALDCSLGPSIDLIRKWILTGSIESSNNSFFIFEKNKMHFEYDAALVPLVFGSISYKSFQIGKTLVYLKSILKSYEWCESYAIKYKEKCNPLDANIINEMFNEIVMKFNNSILSVYLKEIVNLKSFLLLSQGDFINSLITKGSDILNMSTNNLTSFQLIQLLQESINSTSIKFNYPAEVYNRLDARLLNIESFGSVGWKLFTLDYHLNEEIDVIIGDQYKEYLRLFNFIVQLKRTELQLSNLWVNSNKLKKFKKSRIEHQLFIKLNILRHQFLSFIHTVYQYIIIEIIDKSYRKFLSKFDNRSSLIIQNDTVKENVLLFTIDDLSRMHKEYIESISRCELFSSKSIIPILLREIIDVIDLFCSLSIQFDKNLKQLNSKEILDNLQSLINEKLMNIHKTLGTGIVEKFETKLNLLVFHLNNIKFETLANLLII